MHKSTKNFPPHVNYVIILPC